MKKIIFYLVFLMTQHIHSFNWKEFCKPWVGFKYVTHNSQKSDMMSKPINSSPFFSTINPYSSIKENSYKFSQCMLLPVAHAWTYLRTKYIFATWGYYEQQKKDIEEIHRRSEQKRQEMLSDFFSQQQSFHNGIESKLQEVSQVCEQYNQKEEEQRKKLLNETAYLGTTMKMRQQILKNLEQQFNSTVSYQEMLRNHNEKLRRIQNILCIQNPLQLETQNPCITNS